MRPGRKVLIIAATDSSGGAGLTRDIQTLSAWRTEACCAVTAVTTQTDGAVQSIEPLAADRVVEQMQAALAQGTIGAIKIGMLATAGIVEAVAAHLPARERVPIVLDPVLIASSGGALLQAAGIERMLRVLLPRVSLLTPNLPEAAALLHRSPAEDESDMREQMRALQALGAGAVLLKGGHAPAAADGSAVVDRLLDDQGEFIRLQTPRVTVLRRGTGCSLASAIAAQLAAGRPLRAACAAAQAYIGAALQGNPWDAPPLQEDSAPR
ncbi:MAG TPA: hydroxymethylpyrimidine/phosphomethylpyrimidine kinase [Steroidobacteraceae bacterium]|nr:hydroxymethylpyrimidine/phosphomethylpyrimidine kinase [Steroidobacteraceae bacterium]